MASHVEKFIAAVVISGDLSAYRQRPSIQPYLQFAEPKDQELFSAFDKHVKTFKTLPNLDLMAEEYGVALKDPGSPPEFWAERLERQHLKRGLVMLANGIGENLSSGDVYELLESARNAVRELENSRGNMRMIDFRNGMEILEAKWAEQNKTAISLGWPTLDNMSGGARGGDLYSMVARPKLGKGLPLDAPILKPDGTWVRNGDLKVGDAVASPDGASSVVTGVYPQGVKPVYRATFKDGRSFEMDDTHLWLVNYREWSSPRTLTTLQVVGLMSKTRYQGRLWVDMISGEFGSTAPRLDPYVLGVLLGDGCLRASTPRITSMDAEIVQRVRQALPKGHVLADVSSGSSGQAQDWSISPIGGGTNRVTEVLKTWGLMGLKSEDKFIPEEVYAWPRQDRLALLQGLLDTDGEAGAGGVAVFGSSGRALYEGVRRLVWSLGGQATEQAPKKTTHQDHYRTCIRLPDRENVFSLQRKKDRIPSTSLKNPERLVLQEIVYARSAETQCISVSHPSHLYVTQDYLPTHNTYLMTYSALHVWATQRRPLLFVSNEMIPEMIVERMAALATKTPADILKNNQWPAFGKGGFQGKQSDNKVKKSFVDQMHVIETDDVPLWVVDGNLSSTVDDVAALADRLGACMVFDDGAYLHQDARERDQYRRVSLICSDLKMKVATGLRIPVFASWQFNRDAQKLKPDETPGLEHIAHSDSIGQLSSVVMGMFQGETIETKKRREVAILAGRSGEVGSFTTYWDFETMNLSEVLPDDDAVESEALYEMA